MGSPIRKKFEAMLKGEDGMETAALVAPFDVTAVFGRKGRVPVKGTINGVPFRSSFMNMGEGHFMVVNAQLREKARCKAGDVVRVELELDEEERTVELPSYLEKMVKSDKEAAEGWSKMSFTHKKEHTRAIEDAKKPETKERRIASMMEALRAASKKKR